MKAIYDRTNWIIAGGVVAVLLLAFDAVFGIPNALGYQNTSFAEMLSRRDFDSDVWKRAAKDGTSVRLKMVDALLRQHRLAGLSRPRLEAILGQPDGKHYLGYEYVYWLGPERGFLPIDDEWLGVNFKNDIVTEAKDVRD